MFGDGDLFDFGPSKEKLAESLYQINKALWGHIWGLERVLIDKGVLTEEDFKKIKECAVELSKETDKKREDARAKTDAAFEKQHPGMADLAKIFLARAAKPTTEPRIVIGTHATCARCNGSGRIITDCNGDPDDCPDCKKKT